jgi:hypothetical protein
MNNQAILRIAPSDLLLIAQNIALFIFPSDLFNRFSKRQHKIIIICRNHYMPFAG